jgi:hypothetical protein
MQGREAARHARVAAPHNAKLTPAPSTRNRTRDLVLRRIRDLIAENSKRARPQQLRIMRHEGRCDSTLFPCAVWKIAGFSVPERVFRIISIFFEIVITKNISHDGQEEKRPLSSHQPAIHRLG